MRQSSGGEKSIHHGHNVNNNDDGNNNNNNNNSNSINVRKSLNDEDVSSLSGSDMSHHHCYPSSYQYHHYCSPRGRKNGMYIFIDLI
eukprot:11292436-Ditylum_brightwellii.AAC.1